jgi:hypothetical protein
VVVARYSPSYKSKDEEEEEGFGAAEAMGRRELGRAAMLCFKSFRSFRLMFQVFYLEIAEKDPGMLHILQ